MEGHPPSDSEINYPSFGEMIPLVLLELRLGHLLILPNGVVLSQVFSLA